MKENITQLTFKLSDREIQLTPDEARHLYKALKELLEAETKNAPLQVIIKEKEYINIQPYINPYPPYNPYPSFEITCSDKSYINHNNLPKDLSHYSITMDLSK